VLLSAFKFHAPSTARIYVQLPSTVHAPPWAFLIGLQVNVVLESRDKYTMLPPFRNSVEKPSPAAGNRALVSSRRGNRSTLQTRAGPGQTCPAASWWEGGLMGRSMHPIVAWDSQSVGRLCGGWDPIGRHGIVGGSHRAR
jgi:hypothetical protein